MNKTLLTITAAIGLVAASSVAAADSGNVEIYGTLNTDFENVKATGSSAPRALPAGQTGVAPNGTIQPDRNRVTSNSSNIGFRGKEDLGMGLNAIFQIEAGVNMDGSNSASVSGFNSGTSSSVNGTFASRNTNVGLSSSKLGTLFYGQWDTPYKSLTNTVTFDSFYGTGIANSNGIIGTPGFGVATTTQSGRVNGANSVATSVSATTGAITVVGSGNAADASFDRRQGNSVQYWTPQFYGISGRLAYSANEQRSSQTTPVPTFSINPTIYSASIAYEYGPFRAAYSFEQHRDYFGLTALQPAGAGGVGTPSPSATNSTSRDNGNKATLSYKLDALGGTTLLNVAFEQLSYNNSDTTLGDLIHYHRNALYVPVQHRIGASTFRLGFGQAWAGSCNRAGATACSTTGLDARQYSLGYSYSFSKRTDVYGFYTVTNNGQFATYQLANGSGLSSSSGAHNQGFGLGIRHVF